MSGSSNIPIATFDPLAMARALAEMGKHSILRGGGGYGYPHMSKNDSCRVIGTVHIGNDKERVFNFRQKMTAKQVKAIRKATGGNRTTHVLMRANSQFG